MTAELRPLPSKRISAWRRPLVVLGYHAHRLVLAFLLTAPIASALARLARGQKGGELAVFEPGAVFLLEAARLARGTIEWFGATAALLALVWIALGLVPLAWVLLALGHEGSVRPAVVLPRIGASLATLAILLALSAGATVLAIVIAAVGAEAVVQRLGLVPPSADVVRAAILLLGGAVVAAIGVVHDLARAACVDDRRRLYDALRIALSIVKTKPVRVLGAWAWRSVAAVLVVALAIALAGPFAPPASLGGEALLRHATLLCVTALRVSWLAAALRFTAAHRHQPAASS